MATSFCTQVVKYLFLLAPFQHNRSIIGVYASTLYWTRLLLHSNTYSLVLQVDHFRPVVR
jgi:hypothetical protein